VADKRQQNSKRTGVPIGPALVHLFTGLGAVIALLAVKAVLDGQMQIAFAWLGLALVIDTLDGPLARALKVETRLPRFSGERLDLVIDYLTYVFIPALMLLQASFLTGNVGLIIASLIPLSSLYHFSDMRSKSDDNCFVGFPAVWNVVVLYIFAFHPGEQMASLIVLIFVGLTFIPFKWIHPIRVKVMRPVTLSAALLWFAAAAWSIKHGFPAPDWAKLALGAVAVYGILLSLSRGMNRPK